MASLLTLPIELLDNVYQFLDDESLLALRSVNRLTKELAEATVINRTEESTISSLCLTEENNDEIEAEFEFENVHSKLLFISVMNYLRVNRLVFDSNKVSITMTACETAELFGKIAPLMRQTQCEYLELYPSATPEVFSRISPFFEGKSVRELTLGHDDSTHAREFTLSLISQLDSSDVLLYVNRSVLHLEPFLVDAARIVDRLVLATPLYAYGFVNPEKRQSALNQLQRLVKAMLNGRCRYVDFMEGFMEMSLQEAMDLAAGLDVVDKNFYFSAPSSDAELFEDNSTYHSVKIVESSNGPLIQIGNLGFL